MLWRCFKVIKGNDKINLPQYIIKDEIIKIIKRYMKLWFSIKLVTMRSLRVWYNSKSFYFRNNLFN